MQQHPPFSNRFETQGLSVRIGHMKGITPNMEAVNPKMERSAAPHIDAEEVHLRERISAAISAAGGIKALVNLTGIPKGTLEKYASKTSTASLVNAAKIAFYAGVSLDGLAEQVTHSSISGVGGQRGVDALVALADGREVPIEVRQTGAKDGRTQMIPLPFYEGVQASAGVGLTPQVHAQAEAVVSFDHRFLRDKGATPERCNVITARGDSMAPTIPDGSLLVVDHSQTQVGNGYIMVINLGDDLLVKRVHRRIDGLIDLISDNPAYPRETIAGHMLDQLRVVGRVVYFCRVP